MIQPSLEGMLLLSEPDYLVLNKPAGISTLADRNDSYNILSIARDFDPLLQVCHRLDKETSGALVLARNQEAYRLLSIQFEKREVGKVYHAVVEGSQDFLDELIDLPLATNRSGVSMIHRRKGKPSQTIVNTLKKFRSYSLVECKPITGRTHQIRVHLSQVGAPIVGDLTYGGQPILLSKLKRNYRPKKDQQERPIISRPPLHAFEITFLNKDGIKIHQQAPYPKDFNVLLKQLSKHL